MNAKVMKLILVCITCFALIYAVVLIIENLKT